MNWPAMDLKSLLYGEEDCHFLLGHLCPHHNHVPGYPHSTGVVTYDRLSVVMATPQVYEGE